MRRTRSRVAALGMLVAGSMLVAACTSASDISDDATDRSTSDAPTSDGGATTDSTSEPPDSSDAPSEPDGLGAGPAGSGMSRFLQQPVDWKDCDDDESNQCAKIWVPLDYADPDGKALTLALEKQPASDSSNRIGSLFLNPGGPGASGIQFLQGNPIDPEVSAVYDLIGFDPRGVGESTPVNCLSDKEMDSYIASDPFPTDAAEVAQFKADFQTFVDGCEQNSGPLLAHLSTVDVANDLELMRQLLGDDKLNFFGGSYGTYIGATYAGMFPTKVGRMVLDGAVSPNQSSVKTSLFQAEGFERAFHAYAQDCVDQGGCKLGDSPDEVESNVEDFLAGLADNPVPSSTGRDLTEGLGYLGVIEALYAKQLWQYLTIGLDQAMNESSADVLLLIADLYAERNQDGTYSGNLLEAFPAIACLDFPSHISASRIENDLVPQFTAAAPLFGATAAWGTYGCANWPVKSSEQKPDFSAPGAPPIVVIGTTRDPATPYQQAVTLAKVLDSGVLLSRDGDGHTAYLSGNSCINSTVDAYLADGTVPPDGKMC